MSIQFGDVLSAIRFINNVVTQIKDNREELSRLGKQLEYIDLSLEDSKTRNTIQFEEYTDGLTTVFQLVERSQRLIQRQLKLSLGNRTWNRDEISKELKRINLDVQSFLSVHTICAIDTIPADNQRQLTATRNNVTEIMVKLAEVDIRLRTPPGDLWDDKINREAKRDLLKQPPISAAITLAERDPSAPELDMMSTMALVTEGRTNVKVSNIKRTRSSEHSEDIILFGVKAAAKYSDILEAIQAAGYTAPDNLYEQGITIRVTESTSEYDPAAPGGLQISRSIPLLHWWNKYTTRCGLAKASTPGHTLAKLGYDDKSITAGGVTFQFHRTPRVPDGEGKNRLPPSLGCFNLLPVSQFSRHLPEHITSKGGFIMTMSEREALWVSFRLSSTADIGSTSPAVKISVGGINAISGKPSTSCEPPNVEQDYIVAELQPWLDGVMTDTGTVRQFISTNLGRGYTVEEQVTGKADIGGFQFDTFPQRERAPDNLTIRNRYGPLDAQMTPEELLIANDAEITLVASQNGIKHNNSNKWTLADYRGRVATAAGLRAWYEKVYKPETQEHSFFHSSSNFSIYGGQFFNVGGNSQVYGSVSRAGLGLGGKIGQKIYTDPNSPRVYDEENGHRFHVHILSPESWELVTGKLAPTPPATDLTLPWYKLDDDHLPSLPMSPSSSLHYVKSVQAIDDEKNAPSSTNDIDLNSGCCYTHPEKRAYYISRPCSHFACRECYDDVVSQHQPCPMCGEMPERFVEIDIPILAAGDPEMLDKEIDVRNITVIHLPMDRVSPLYKR